MTCNLMGQYLGQSGPASRAVSGDYMQQYLQQYLGQYLGQTLQSSMPQLASLHTKTMPIFHDVCARTYRSTGQDQSVYLVMCWSTHFHMLVYALSYAERYSGIGARISTAKDQALQIYIPRSVGSACLQSATSQYSGQMNSLQIKELLSLPLC